LPGLNAKLRHQTLPEMGERPLRIKITTSPAIEVRHRFGFPRLGIVMHRALSS
jgi:hypothetical protein